MGAGQGAHLSYGGTRKVKKAGRERKGGQVMNTTNRINFEKWWCEEEIKWINQGGNSEFSLDYLNGFIDAIIFSERAGK